MSKRTDFTATELQALWVGHKYTSIKQLAELLGVHHETIRNVLKRDKHTLSPLPVSRAGRPAKAHGEKANRKKAPKESRKTVYLGAASLSAKKWIEDHKDALTTLGIDPKSLSDGKLTPQEKISEDPSIRSGTEPWNVRMEVLRGADGEAIDFPSDLTLELIAPTAPTKAELAHLDTVLRHLDPLDAKVLVSLADPLRKQVEIAAELGITQGATSHSMHSATEKAKRLKVLVQVDPKDIPEVWGEYDQKHSPYPGPRYLFQVWLQCGGKGTQVGEALGFGQPMACRLIKDLAKYLPTDCLEAFDGGHPFGRYAVTTKDGRHHLAGTKGYGKSPGPAKGSHKPPVHPLVAHKQYANRAAKI